MKILARGKVDGYRLAKMKVGFELLKEVERVSEHPCTDIGLLLKEIQRLDLVEKLGLPSPESKINGKDSLTHGKIDSVMTKLILYFAYLITYLRFWWINKMCHGI